MRNVARFCAEWLVYITAAWDLGALMGLACIGKPMFWMALDSTAAFIAAMLLFRKARAMAKPPEPFDPRERGGPIGVQFRLTVGGINNGA